MSDDIRYPIPVDLGTPLPRYVSTGSMKASGLGTWVPLEYAERLATRVRELEGWEKVARRQATDMQADAREDTDNRARIAALEEENFALKSRLVEAKESAESDRRTSAQVFEQVERLGEENAALEKEVGDRAAAYASSERIRALLVERVHALEDENRRLRESLGVALH